jgi:phenylacetate-CoA ligase
VSRGEAQVGSVLEQSVLYGGDSERVERFQDRLLRASLERVLARHPTYRSVYAGCAPAAMSIRDLDGLPVTTKAEFVANPDGYRLEPDPQAPGEYVTWDIAYTAGTTSGNPTPIVQTAFDLRGILLAQRRMAEIRRFRSDDVILNLYPLGPYPHGGWIRPTQAAAAFGIPVIVGMSGSSGGDDFGVTRRVAEIARMPALQHATIAWGVPTFLLRFLEQVRDEGTRMPKLRLVAASGEPCRASLRRAITEAAALVGAEGPIEVSDSLGSTELQFSLVECSEGSGFHNPAPELVHVAAVDADGRHVPPGESGRLAYTHLNRRGTVLMRYLVGDIAVVSNDQCGNCGWSGGVVTRLLGRESSFVKVRGMLFSVDAVHAAVDAVEPVKDHRIEVSRDEAHPGAMDLLTVSILVTDPDRFAAAAQEVEDAVRAVTGVTPLVQRLTAAELWVPEERMKPVRFRDSRSEV